MQESDVRMDMLVGVEPWETCPTAADRVGEADGGGGRNVDHTVLMGFPSSAAIQPLVSHFNMPIRLPACFDVDINDVCSH